jgi:WD40 repeat protein
MPYDLTELQADIAQVQHEDAGFGTGRLVAENLILTAAHTLWNKDDDTDPIREGWQVRLARDRSGSLWPFRRDNRVVWCDRVCDLALIQLVNPEGGPLRPQLSLRVATVSRANRHSVEARGYPRAAKQADGPRDLTLALGRLTATEHDRPLHFGVDNCDLPNDPHAGWRGMSGSAVLLEDCPDPKTIWVYGVVRLVPGSFDRRLDVARLADAWKDATFRGLLVAAGAPDMDAADPTGEPERDDKAPSGPNPYKGLLQFEEADADRFFGRENLTNDLYARLSGLLEAGEDRPRLLPVLGPSGSGKSSLVRAGLVPRLRRERFAQLVEPRVMVLTPGSHPLEALARELARLATGEGNLIPKTDEFLEVLGRKDRMDGLRRIVDDLTALGPARVVVVVDQFEELYVTPAAPKERESFEAERDRFIGTLMNAASDRGGRMVALVVMRSDFLGETQRHPALNAQIARSGFLVPAMGKEELEDAIRKPAAQTHPRYEFQEAFVDLLVNEVLGRPGALPLLQFALQRVWDELPRDPAETLDNLGGVGGVLAVYAESEFGRLSESDQAIARRAFLAMVNLGEGTADTRRRAKLDEITPNSNSREQELSVLWRFSRPEARLITLSGEPGGEVAFEVAHETLIRSWDRLRRWLDESRDDLRFLRRAQERAQLWEDGEGGLFAFPELGQLTKFAQRVPEYMTARLTRFLVASNAAETARQLRERRRKRLLRSWAGAATIFFLLVSVGSVYLAYKLDTERRTTSQLLVEQAERAAQEKDYFLALGLANRAWDNWQYLATEYRQRAYGVVREMLAANQRLLRILPQGGHVRAVAFDPKGELALTGSEDNTARLWDVRSGELVGRPMQHIGAVMVVAFDQKDDLVVTGSEDQTARLWNARTGEPVGKPMQHQGAVRAVAFDPRGERVVTGSLDKTARLWNARSGDPVGRPMQHGDLVIAVAFDPTGERVVTGSEDYTARLWNASSGEPIGRPMQHDNAVLVAACDPKGELLVTGSRDKTARLWDARDGRPIGRPMAHDAPVWAAAFDTKGELLVTGSGDNKARLWNARTGEPVGKPMPHDGPVKAVAFDPSGERVATGSLDKTVRLWNAKTGDPIGGPMRHDGPVTAVAFDAKGERIITGSEDGTARLWDARASEPIEKPMQHDGPVMAVAFDPSGELVATGSEDNKARLWSRRTAEPVGTPMQHHGPVVAIAFDRKGERVVTGSWDRTARLWDTRTSEPIGQPMQHDARVVAVAFDRKGDRVVTGSKDKTARLWNAHTGEPVGKPMQHDGSVVAVAFDPTGERVVTGSEDNTARLWNAGTGEPVGNPMHHLDAVVAVAFAPNGERVATGAAWKDRTARLWNAGTGEPIGKPMRHESDLTTVAFDPTGERVVTGSMDNTARLWDARTGEPVGTPMQHRGPVTAIAFDHQGKLLATGSQDNTVRLWSARTGAPVGAPMQHDGVVWAVAFDPRDRLVATGSWDNVNAARLWLALSAQTLFQRGRSILGAAGGPDTIPMASPDFLTWLGKKIGDAV